MRKRQNIFDFIPAQLFIYFVILICPFNFITGQSTLIYNTYQTDSGLTKLTIERSMVYIPQKEWMYSHHPSITIFKDKILAIWSNGMIDEDAPGQRVVYAVSTDFVHWSAPKILALPSRFCNDTFNVLTAAGFYQFHDTLVAYYGEYSPKKTHTHLWAKTSMDGEHWSGPIDMHIPVNPNHGPQALSSGRLLISGNFSFPYTDDASGLRGWHIRSFYDSSLYSEDNPSSFYSPAAKNQFPPLCEASFFQTKDDKIHALLRVTGMGWKGKLWLTESEDMGNHWTQPVETPFSDNDSKFHFGQLPDHRFYYVGIPDTFHHYARNPLVLSVSSDGKTFDKHYIIANQLYQLKKEGLWKGGQYGYPHTLIDKGYLYVIISRQKEAIEVIRILIKQIE